MWVSPAIVNSGVRGASTAWRERSERPPTGAPQPPKSKAWAAARDIFTGSDGPKHARRKRRQPLVPRSSMAQPRRRSGLESRVERRCNRAQQTGCVSFRLQSRHSFHIHQETPGTPEELSTMCWMRGARRRPRGALRASAHPASTGGRGAAAAVAASGLRRGCARARRGRCRGSQRPRGSGCTAAPSPGGARRGGAAPGGSRT